MIRSRQLRGSRSGFTLIEMMIVIAILGIITIPLLAMFLNARNFSEVHLLFTRAAALLAEQAEIVKATPYAELEKPSPRAFDPSLADALAQLPKGEGKLETAPFSGQPGIKRIVLRVNWENPWGAPKSLHTVLLRSAP